MIDEIDARELLKIFLHEVDMNRTVYGEGGQDQYSRIEDKALTAIYEIGLEVIGQDVVEEDDSGGKYKLNKYLVAENRLRRQQRKAWAKACGVAEK